MMLCPSCSGRSLTGGKALPISNLLRSFLIHCADPQQLCPGGPGGLHAPPRGALRPDSEYAVTVHAPERGGLGGAPVRSEECDARTIKEALIGGLTVESGRCKDERGNKLCYEVRRYELENCVIKVKATIA